MKKFLVLGILFALPITAYLFFALGENNFIHLPVLTENVEDVASFKTSADSTVSFKSKITVLAFFGSELSDVRGNTFNLDQEILEKYYGFNDFQFVILLPKGTEEQTDTLVEKFKDISNSQAWKFVFAKPEEIKEVFRSLESPFALDKNLHSPYIFIIDKEVNLRGREEDDGEPLYGYDSRNVAELNNKMNDDIKIVLAEYRLALKKNNVYKDNEK